MAGTFNELGNLGAYRWSGQMHEEFLLKLRGRRGVETYKQMAENDDIIGASLFAIEMLLRQVSWDVKEAGHTEADKNAKEFVASCIDDLDTSWTDFISEALSFLTFGWSYHEIVYKRRMGHTKRGETNSKHSDGLIGWRKLPVRSQDTLWEWRFDEEDNLLGLIQCAPPRYEHIFIPIEKALHFRTKARKGNPEGRSILRSAYTSWEFKRHIQEFEGIGIERDLAGLPVLQAPEGTDLWNPEFADHKAQAEQIVRAIRRDEKEGVLLPPGWNLSLMASGGKRQFDTNETIERYDNRIAMTMLADFVMLGHEQVGSFALSSDKTEMFGVAMGTFLDVICEVFNNQAIPRLIDVNGDAFAGITAYPELVHGDIETQDLSSLGTFIKEMVGIGVITPDEDLEDYLRRAASLPERDENATYMGNGVTGNDDDEPKEPDDEPSDDKPPKEVEKRKGQGLWGFSSMFSNRKH